MEKQGWQTKLAEKEEKEKAIESQKEKLRLLAERQVARCQEEKRAQEHPREMSEHQQSMERAVAYYDEIEAFRQAEEEKLRQVAEQEEQKKRDRAEVKRLRSNTVCLVTVKHKLLQIN